MRDFEKRLTYLKEESNFETQLDYKKIDDFLSLHKKEYLNDHGIKLINNYIGCSHCHTGFQGDTYLNGCTFECKYCYAKLEGEKSGKWNEPVPLPLDFTLLWEIFYKVFEKKEEHQFSDVLLKKIPLRLGSLSDPFLHLENKLQVTREVIRLLQFYKYPYLIITRSALIGEESYLSLMNKSLAAIQISIPSLDAKKTHGLEPGAPDPESRLQTMKILRERGFWLTARINPFFPCFPDGHLSNGGSWDDDSINKCSFFSEELMDEIAKTGCKSVLVGFVTMKSFIIEKVSESIDYNIRSLMKDGKGDFNFSSSEMRQYFIYLHHLAKKNNMDFSTCYLGQAESEYYSHQDLWDNAGDCCNLKGNLDAFKNTSTEIDRHQYIDDHQEQNLLKRFVLKMLSYLLAQLKK